MWAIGKKIPAAAEYVVTVTMQLRTLCAQKARACRIIYGGSAGSGTFQGMRCGVDGLFLGRFGHDFKNLKVILNEVGAC